MNNKIQKNNVILTIQHTSIIQSFLIFVSFILFDFNFVINFSIESVKRQFHLFSSKADQQI